PEGWDGTGVRRDLPRRGAEVRRPERPGEPDLALHGEASERTDGAEAGEGGAAAGPLPWIEAGAGEEGPRRPQPRPALLRDRNLGDLAGNLRQPAPRR